MTEPTHMTSDQIDQAEGAGILSPKQASAMKAELALSEPKSVVVDPGEPVIGNEDDLRFLRSFGDVFIGVGLILLALGVSAVIALLGGGPVFLLAAAGAYMMAEYFGRMKRAHFPTLISALAFLVFVQTGLSGVASLSGSAAALITVIAMALFYMRIRLPFCIALIAVSLIYLLFAVLVQIAPDLLRSRIGLVLILSGLSVFAAALAYDIQDSHRRTRYADNAFWLHLLAAPLLIHGLVGQAVMSKSELLFDFIPIFAFTERDAIIILVGMAVITVIGLAINRRALIISALGYAGFAIGFFVTKTSLSFGTALSVTLIVLGAAIVLLGVAWHPVRNQLIRTLPKWRVFPPPFEPLENTRSS